MKIKRGMRSCQVSVSCRYNRFYISFTKNIGEKLGIQSGDRVTILTPSVSSLDIILYKAPKPNGKNPDLASEYSIAHCVRDVSKYRLGIKFTLFSLLGISSMRMLGWEIIDASRFGAPAGVTKALKTCIDYNLDLEDKGAA